MKKRSYDLHVLSSPLAFILSQDRTLRFIRKFTYLIFCFFFKSTSSQPFFFNQNKLSWIAPFYSFGLLVAGGVLHLDSVDSKADASGDLIPVGSVLVSRNRRHYSEKQFGEPPNEDWMKYRDFAASTKPKGI